MKNLLIYIAVILIALIAFNLLRIPTAGAREIDRKVLDSVSKEAAEKARIVTQKEFEAIGIRYMPEVPDIEFEIKQLIPVKTRPTIQAFMRLKDPKDELVIKAQLKELGYDIFNSELSGRGRYVSTYFPGVVIFSYYKPATRKTHLNCGRDMRKFLTIASFAQQ